MEGPTDKALVRDSLLLFLDTMKLRKGKDPAFQAFEETARILFKLGAESAFTKEDIVWKMRGLTELLKGNGLDPGDNPKIFLMLCGLDPEPSETRSETKGPKTIEGSCRPLGPRPERR